MEVYNSQIKPNQFTLQIQLSQNMIDSKNITKSPDLTADLYSTDSNSITQTDTDRSNDLKKNEPEFTNQQNNAWGTKIIRQKMPTIVKTTVVTSLSAAEIKANQEQWQRTTSILNNKSVQQFFSANEKEEESVNTISYSVFKSNLFKGKHIDEMASRNIICSFSSVNYFNKSNPIFGYLISYETDKKNQKVPTLIPELVSFKALPKLLRENLENLEKNNKIVYKIKDKKQSYYNWLPVFIKEEHFRDARPLFENSIRKLASINDESIPNFTPQMILKTLIPLIKGLIFKIREKEGSASNEIQALGDLFMLTRKLLTDDYQNLKYELNDEIMKYLADEDECLKIQDVMTYGLFSEINLFSDDTLNCLFNMAFQEALRKVYKIDLKKNNAEELIRPLRKTAQILLTFREAWLFLNNEETSDDMEFRYGILCKERIAEFGKKMNWLKTLENCNLRVLKKDFPNHVDIKAIKSDFKAYITLNSH